MSDTPKKIEIVSGKGENLKISSVSTHLSIAKPKMKNENTKNKEIVIPKNKKDSNTKNEN